MVVHVYTIKICGHKFLGRVNMCIWAVSTKKHVCTHSDVYSFFMTAFYADFFVLFSAIVHQISASGA